MVNTVHHKHKLQGRIQPQPATMAVSKQSMGYLCAGMTWPVTAGTSRVWWHLYLHHQVCRTAGSTGALPALPVA
jgi:hypothetical protein